ncbi:unnamed protein product [Paramecium primaurelia]|uniref:Phospholipase/carboxylesterase/thioesterase domain-containing protein n=1 Tax=Paramecium primaurelia TaxID=5886 RepID=A0A8S1P4S2_PARPR|nr:unnamed protein product [Paramecium primaurelia]
MFIKQQKQPDGSLILFPQLEHKYSLIWMHGLGDSANGFLSMFQKYSIVKPETKILLLQAPNRRVTINNGHFSSSWFDIKVLEPDIEKNQELDYFKTTVSIEEIEQSKIMINQYLNEEVVKVQAKNVFIGGFSQGCCMALEVGLSYSQTLGGIIGLSGDLFPTTQLHQIQDKTPLLIIHGKDDQVVPCDFLSRSLERLKIPNRVNYEHIILSNLEHEVNQQVVQLMIQFFQKYQI